MENCIWMENDRKMITFYYCSQVKAEGKVKGDIKRNSHDHNNDGDDDDDDNDDDHWLSITWW